MKNFGGYYELALSAEKDEFHQDAVKLNTARNAFEYLLKVKEPRKVIIPFYLCEVLLEPIRRLNLTVEYYGIDSDFLPLVDTLEEDALMLYINYFGVNDHQALMLTQKWSKQLVLDNTQAFFTPPPNCAGTFYSARKFFGVPDGAYLYTNQILPDELEREVSYERCMHLLKRLDVGPEEGYNDFVENDKSLSGLPIRKMSNLSSKLLSRVDYFEVKRNRKANFEYLHQHLEQDNQLKLNISNLSGPLCYPLLVTDGKERKQELINKRVFVPTYWKAVKEHVGTNSFEWYLVENLICLPIDQRYDRDDMRCIIELYQSCGKS